jgi:ATP synthase protein I
VPDPSNPQDDALENALKKAQQPNVPPPSLGALLAWTGRLGWALVLPIVGGALLGRAIDRAIGQGVMVTAGLIFLGAVIGFSLMWIDLRKGGR